MKVAMIIQNFHPFIGGAEKQAQALSYALQARGVTVQVLTRKCSSLPASEKIGSLRVRRLFSAGPAFVSAFFFSISLAFHLLTNAYDVFHIHLASSHSILPAFVGRLFQKKVLIKLGGGYEIGELALSRRSQIGRFKLMLLRLAQPIFIAVNAGQRDELKSSGLQSARVEMVPNGVDLSYFCPPSPSEKDELRRKFGWTGLVFLFVGRFAPDKLRPDIFERLLNAWSKHHKGNHLVFVGNGPLRDEFEKMVREKLLENSVKLLPASSNVRELYHAADVFVLPSITEGLSNALLEAMACGLPVLGSRVPGIVDVVKENEHGALFDPMSQAEMERAVSALVENPERRRTMGRQCRLDVEAYSLETVADRVLALYKEPVR